MEPTDLDSIGETGGMTGNFMGPFSPRSIQAIPVGDSKCGLYPGFNEAAIVNFPGDFAEHSVEFSVGGHRFDQDQRQRLEIGRLDCRFLESLAEPGHDFGIWLFDKSVKREKPRPRSKTAGSVSNEWSGSCSACQRSIRQRVTSSEPRAECERSSSLFGGGFDTSKRFLDASVHLVAAWEEHLDRSGAERAPHELE
jgi:hypothetical protein